MDWHQLISSLHQILQEWGYWGMGLAGFLSGTVVPFSSEAVLAVLLNEGLDPFALFVIAVVSNCIGGYTTFWIGHLGKLNWIEKYFRVKHQKLLDWEHRVEKYGAYFAILGWLPIFGNVILLSLGFFHANPRNTAWWMFVGKTVRYAGIIWLMN